MNDRNQRGFIALGTVLVLSAIVLSVGIGASSRMVGATSYAAAHLFGQEATLSAQSCAEHALMELQRTLHYEGDETLSIEDESCDIHPIEGSGNTDRIIEVESTVGGHTRRIRVEVDVISPALQIGSWYLVSEF